MVVEAGDSQTVLKMVPFLDLMLVKFSVLADQMGMLTVLSLGLMLAKCSVLADQMGMLTVLSLGLTMVFSMEKKSG